ncbi:uncharacterized protein LOC121416759 [Lytechinus variegatus]|uniref:uncharacterized protein LOC121416759 n=1 Tax=Lytechinus variegatus TaxID=7654 RepID=UPI001BB21B34|nr:uncharacterized protein LOC121416759 [Lytechinus variegatus]
MGSSNKKRQQGEDEGSSRSLSLQEILSLLTRGGKFTRMFRGWKLCSLVHDKPILYGLPDDPKSRLRRSNSLYLSAYDDFPKLISKSAKLTNLHSPSSSISAKLSASNLHQQGQRSALKVRSCHAAETENAASLRKPFQLRGPMRPSSSGTVSDRKEDVVRSVSLSEQRAVMDDLNDLMQTKDSSNYTANYKGGYTYRKLHDQRPRSSSTHAVTATPASTAVTKVTNRCSSSSPLSHPLAKASLGRIEILPVGAAQKSGNTPTSRSTPTIPKATPTTTRSTPTSNSITKAREKCNHGGQSEYGVKDQDFDQKIVSLSIK